MVDTKIAVLSIAEISSAITAACLPTLRPLVIGDSPCNLITKVRTSFSSSLSSMRRSSVRHSNGSSSNGDKVEVTEFGSKDLMLNYVHVKQLDRAATLDRYSQV